MIIDCEAIGTIMPVLITPLYTRSKLANFIKLTRQCPVRSVTQCEAPADSETHRTPDINKTVYNTPHTPPTTSKGQ